MVSRISRGALRNGPESSAEVTAGVGWGLGIAFVAMGGRSIAACSGSCKDVWAM